MRPARFSALLAVFGIALFASSGRATQSAPTETYFCMCYCADGSVVCVEDTSPDCNACATACPPGGGSES